MMLLQRCKNTNVTNWNKYKDAKFATIFNNKFVISIKYLGMIELIPIFALPNQLLIRVIKNVFAYYNHNLVLIK